MKRTGPVRRKSIPSSFSKGVRLDRGLPRKQTKRPQGADGGQTDTWVNGHAAHYRIREIRCGKPRCSKCPHARYKYLVWRENGRTRERYVGVARE